jgi:hypothetical protein
MCAQPGAFDHGRVGVLLLVTTCVFCNTHFWTPNQEVVRMIERIHRCPQMLQALKDDSASPAK